MAPVFSAVKSKPELPESQLLLSESFLFLNAEFQPLKIGLIIGVQGNAK
jgi:hypothetical protein